MYQYATTIRLQGCLRHPSLLIPTQPQPGSPDPAQVDGLLQADKECFLDLQAFQYIKKDPPQVEEALQSIYPGHPRIKRQGSKEKKTKRDIIRTGNESGESKETIFKVWKREAVENIQRHLRRRNILLENTENHRKVQVILSS